MSGEGFNLDGLVEKHNPKGTLYYENDSGEIIVKVCTKCHKVKLLSNFSKRKSYLGGCYSYCKSCVAEESRVYREENRETRKEYFRKYYEENKERHSQTMRKWREANKERDAELKRRWEEDNKEHVYELRRKYYVANKERIEERVSIWREANKERVAENKRKYEERNREKLQKAHHIWRESNREKIKAYHQRRRARKKHLVDDLTAEQMKITFEFFKGCALTGTDDIHWDHVIPLSTGHCGTTYGNMVPLSAELNQSKQDKNIFEWFEANRQRFELSQERFDNLIAYLASANAMTVEEYRAHVYWCHENPRDLTELEAN